MCRYRHGQNRNPKARAAQAGRAQIGPPQFNPAKHRPPLVGADHARKRRTRSQRRRLQITRPKRIAASLKRSAERSRRRKSNPYRFALSMPTFYINRAQRRLTAEFLS